MISDFNIARSPQPSDCFLIQALAELESDQCVLVTHDRALHAPYLKRLTRNQAKTPLSAISATLSIASQICSNLIWRHSAHRSLLSSPSVHISARQVWQFMPTPHDSPGSAPRWTAHVALPQGFLPMELLPKQPVRKTRAAQCGALPVRVNVPKSCTGSWREPTTKSGKGPDKGRRGFSRHTLSTQL